MQTYLLVSSDENAINHHIDAMKKDLTIPRWNYEEIVPSPSIGIDEVRMLKQTLSLKPMDGKNRIVVMKDFDKATLEAQQAILKILEEPPPHTYLVLITNNTNSLLPTIVSRCQIIRLTAQKGSSLPEADSVLTLIYNVCKAGIGERIILAQQYAKGKEEVLVLLQSILWALEQLLYADTEKKLSKSHIAALLSKTAAAKRFIEGNVNYKATLDILFIGFPQIK